MRKNSIIRALAALSALLALAACSATLESEWQARESHFAGRTPATGKTITITATFEAAPGETTKTSLNESMQVLWQAGDKIKVFNSANTSGVEFTLEESSAGSNVGVFTGLALSGSGPYYAVYPSSAAGTLDGEAVSLTLPQTQVLTADSFGRGANVSLAKVENLSDPLQFMNVLGAVSFTLTADTDVTAIRVQTLREEALWGAGSVIMADYGAPALTMDADANVNVTDDDRLISLEGTATGKTFYLMLPPWVLTEGFFVQVVSGSSAMVRSGAAKSSNMVVRSEILAMPEFAFSGNVQADFMNPATAPVGYYGSVQPGGTASSFTFNKESCQYASKVVDGDQRYFRIQSMSAGKMYSITVPQTLTLGATVSATQESIDGSTQTSPASASYVVIQKARGAAWLIESTTAAQKKGFIVLMED